MKPDLTFVEQVSELSHQTVQRCFYCLRCSAGCPAAYAMDYTPAQILRLVQLGQKDTLLHSSAIWLCIGCETCGTRCPNQIHAGAVIDALRQLALKDNVPAAEKSVVKLHKAFLSTIHLWGRLHEVSMLAQYAATNLASRAVFGNIDMGAALFLKGKLELLPNRTRDMQQLRALFSLGEEEAPGED
jgi:heterodisulfide reductase subunit C